MEKETKKITRDQIDVPVRLLIRFTKRSDEVKERALLIAVDDKGREYAFTYRDDNDDMHDLTVCDL
jgi:hypothetical protein